MENEEISRRIKARRVLKDKLELFGGYDPKQLHHAVRMTSMMDGLLSGSNYGTVLTFCEEARENLLKLKVDGVGSKENAVQMMDNTVAHALQQYHKVWNDRQPREGFQVSSNTLKYMEDLVYHMVEVGLR